MDNYYEGFTPEDLSFLTGAIKTAGDGLKKLTAAVNQLAKSINELENMMAYD